MSLMQKAVATYDHFSHLAGIRQVNHAILTPVSHILQTTQIEITLHSDGDFAVATAVDEKTVIPATEESASRTNTPCAHPLCDQLAYVAAGNEEKHRKYLSALSKWAESQYSHQSSTPCFSM